MLARLLIVSMLSGAAFVALGLEFGLSAWMLLLGYAIAGAAGLMLSGTLAALSGSLASPREGFGSAQPEPAPVRLQR
jgi:hypothetical protein